MPNRPSRIAALCLLLICALFTTACGTNGKPPESIASERTILVGFSQLGAESGWRVGNTRDVIAAAERAGVRLMYLNAEQAQENQIKAIRSFIAYQVDVITLAPIVEEGWDTVLREAKDAGIPVLLTDRAISVEDENLFAGFLGSDFLEEGRRAGRFLLEKTKDAPLVRIVEISGTINSTPMKQRAIGFREILDGDPRYEIITSVSGDFLRSKGKECMENILKETIDIDVLYSHNDAMTLGAIEAIEAVGLRPGEDIIIITVDGEQGAIDLLKEGRINCVVECTPLIGDMAMELVKKLAAGEPIPRVTYSRERAFTEFDDDLDALPARGY
ncbi:MAG: ABC transporter substrate-binding protein [Oscillospiraceae bacterium]|jgi:simple sugar transport system substrate-binding protein|nr:ABC transporter substrate-binding protein [Oscillospiraceae bacterium]